MSKHRVYYLYAGDLLVYIGCTTNLKERLRIHRCSKQFTRYKSIGFEHRANAYAFEAAEIRKHKPMYNRGNNGGRKKLPENEKMLLVGFYTKKENVDRVGGLARAREIAKNLIEAV